MDGPFTVNLNDLLSLLIIYQGFTFSVILILARREKPGFRPLLGGFCLLLALHFTNVLLINRSVIPPAYNLGVAFSLLYGPLLLGYTQVLIFLRSKTKRRPIFHYRH